MRVFFFFGIVCLIMSAAAFSQCQKPNPTSKACHTPSGAVVICDGWNEQSCPSKAVYEIAQFPDGPVNDPDGDHYTAQPLTNCWRSKQCFFDFEQNPDECMAPTLFSPYNQAPKVEFGTLCNENDG